MASRVLPPVQHRGLALRSTTSRSKHRAPGRAEKPPAEFLVPTAARNTPRHNICIDVLLAGNLESYIELFDITEKDEDNALISENSEYLSAIAIGLTDAENAARKHDREAEYMTFKRLGDFLEEEGLLMTACRFRARAESVAQSLNDAHKLSSAQSMHGLLLEKIGEVEGASQCFETALAVQKRAGINVASTVGHIIRVKTAVADRFENTGDMGSSLQVFTDAKELALANAQMEAATQCMYRMGNASERLGDAQGAIEHLERYMSSPVRVDQASKNLACAVLARCYERLGGESNTETALQYLQKLVETTAEAQQAKTLDDKARVQALAVTLATARASAMLPGMAFALQNASGDTAAGDTVTPADSLSVMLQWTSQRREGFTGGSFETGFQPYDPVAEKAAKQKEFARKLHRRQSELLVGLGQPAGTTRQAEERAAAVQTTKSLVTGMFADVDKSKTMDAVAASKPGTAASRTATPSTPQG